MSSIKTNKWVYYEIGTCGRARFITVVLKTITYPSREFESHRVRFNSLNLLKKVIGPT